VQLHDDDGGNLLVMMEDFLVVIQRWNFLVIQGEDLLVLGEDLLDPGGGHQLK